MNITPFNLRNKQRNTKTIVYPFQKENISILVIRSHRKNISLQWKDNQWQCLCPIFFSDNQLMNWLEINRRKIEGLWQKVNEQRKSSYLYQGGEEIYLWGKKYLLKREYGNFSVKFLENTMIIRSRKKDFSDFYRWAQIQLQEEYESVAKHYKERLRQRGYFLSPNYRFRVMKSRWGSCLPMKNQICLNTLLIHFPKDCFCYVLWHEFCHFLQANHSARFWQEVSLEFPNYQRIKKMLH